jgi:hypothetical protein
VFLFCKISSLQSAILASEEINIQLEDCKSSAFRVQEKLRVTCLRSLGLKILKRVPFLGTGKRRLIGCKCPQQEQRPYFQHIDQHWTHWGYEVVDFDNLAGTYDQVHEDRCRVGDLGQPQDQCVRAVLFERSDSQVPGSYIIPPKSLYFPLCVVQWH